VKTQTEHVHAGTSMQEDIARCVHCGFCLQACPTYLQLGTETDSPRGRIALIDAMTSGRVGPAPALLQHLDLCLQCRACETACPSGVPFGRIMERARSEVMESDARPTMWRLRALALRQVVAHPGRLAALMHGLKTFEQSPLRAIVRRSRLLERLPGGLSEAEASLPEVPRTPFRPPAQPRGLTRRVAMLTGCVMEHLYPRTHEATIRVLNRLGFEVVLPEQQTCCGALSAHAGDLSFARELARRNIDAFLGAGVEAVIVNSAGCGSTMKEYADLLAADPTYTERAVAFASIAFDVLEFVAGQTLPELGPVGRVVTYQDSCHLVHAQKVTKAPRAILAAIPGIELRELAAPDRCCGSAGLYSLVQREMSARLLGEKMDDVIATRADTIATANPGCMTQLESGVRQRDSGMAVVHVIDLLDEAMRAAPDAPAGRSA
jgi:Fe-S oxidoreductase